MKYYCDAKEALGEDSPEDNDELDVLEDDDDDDDDEVIEDDTDSEETKD